MYLIWLLICFVIACVIREFAKKFTTENTEERDIFSIGIPIAFFVFIGVFSPSIYEYKHLASKPFSQYKILRDEKDKIVGLVKDDTGFHKPFMAETRFIQLYQDADWKRSVNYRLQDGSLVTITYKATCPNYPKTFVLTNGEFGDLRTQSSFNSLISSVDNSFVFQLQNGVKAESTDKKFSSEKELYEYARSIAEKWSYKNNTENQYAVNIQIYTDVKKTTDFNTFWSQQ